MIEVAAEWDEAAGVWVATSDEVTGLVTEAETIEALLARLRVMIPELLEANGRGGSRDIPFRLHGVRLDRAHVA